MPKQRIKLPIARSIEAALPGKRRSVASKAKHALLSPVGGAIVGTARDGRRCGLAGDRAPPH